MPEFQEIKNLRARLIDNPCDGLRVHIMADRIEDSMRNVDRTHLDLCAAIIAEGTRGTDPELAFIKRINTSTSKGEELRAALLAFATWQELNTPCSQNDLSAPDTFDLRYLTAQSIRTELRRASEPDNSALAATAWYLRSVQIDCFGPAAGDILRNEPNRISFKHGIIDNLNLIYSAAIKTLPAGLCTLGDASFWGCTNLKSFTSISSGGTANFRGCTDLQSFTSISSGRHVNFWGCSSLQSFNSLFCGNHAGFENCTKLNSSLLGEITVAGRLHLDNINLTEDTARAILDSDTLSDMAKITGLRSAGYEALAEQAERRAQAARENQL